MADSLSDHAFTSTVGIVRLPSCSYPAPDESENPVAQALARLADGLGWSNENGPFGRIIPRGARVLIKPNLVLHRNEGPGGVDCLVTHASVIRSATDAVLRTGAAEVLVGDAPIQGCDFDELIKTTGLDGWSRERMARNRDSRACMTFAARTACWFMVCASRWRTCSRKSSHAIRPGQRKSAGTA